MTADGTVKYGSAALQMRAHIDGGPTLNIRHVNKERKYFFSSRRLHTRWTVDWSSDVCSSDLLFFFWCIDTPDVLSLPGVSYDPKTLGASQHVISNHAPGKELTYVFGSLWEGDFAHLQPCRSEERRVGNVC